MKPAWSQQFDPDHLRAVAPLSMPNPVTRDWAWGDATGAGVKVAIIDSGVDGSHPAVGGIQGGAAFEYDENADDLVRMIPGPHEDLFGHGTACAAIIRSLAPDCEIYSVRVLGSRLSGKGFVFAAGVQWAIEHGMNVINISMSTGNRDYFEVFHELADQAYFRNIIVVSAVNNVEAECYPSLYSSVFSVAAHDGKDPFGFDYNSSPPVEFGAPGIDLEVAWQNGGTIEATGNSFACPHIAGLVTRILSKHPGLTPFQVKTVLHALANNAEAPAR